jgi:hypothetical protein
MCPTVGTGGFHSESFDEGGYCKWCSLKRCERCDGTGGIVYGDTACGRGAGGQMITTVPCNKCLGTGVS